MRFLIFCVALVGCGGIIDTGDGGSGGVDSGAGGSDSGTTKKDGSSAPDAIVTPTCTQVQTETAVDANGGCQSSASWSCGDTKYSVQCECPSTKCTCSSQTSQGGTAALKNVASFCPACDGSQLPSICGFPTN